MNDSTPRTPSQPKKGTDSPVNIINVSGGLQSTTLALLSITGTLDRADAGIFADTGWEKKDTYTNIEMLIDYGKQHDFPIHVCRGKGNIRDQALNPEYDFIHMPVFSVTASGKRGMTKRQCTDHYKIRPIRKALREIYGKNATFVQWIGISTDEALRMRQADVKYITNRYPLIELGWSRADCAEWLQKNGFGVPSKSSCIGCPFHSNETWLALNEEERADAIEVDESIRNLYQHKTKRIEPKKTNKGQIEIFDLETLDAKHDNPDYGELKSDMKLHLHQSGEPLADFFAAKPAAQKQLFPDEQHICTGDCFL